MRFLSTLTHISALALAARNEFALTSSGIMPVRWKLTIVACRTDSVGDMLGLYDSAPIVGIYGCDGHCAFHIFQSQ
jgi:hypothetical protein